jgi:hypothetical protein
MFQVNHMTDLMEKAIASVRSWPARQQDEAAEILLALDRLGADAYVAGEDELLAIDEALAQIEAGEYATDAEIKTAYSRFRKSKRGYRRGPNARIPARSVLPES